jgi:hypothetical protein
MGTVNSGQWTAELAEFAVDLVLSTLERGVLDSGCCKTPVISGWKCVAVKAWPGRADIEVEETIDA